MLFSADIRSEFGVETITSPEMQSTISYCSRIFLGVPEWVDEDNGIKTIGMAEFVCAEIGKLSTIGISIKMEGESARIKKIQKQVNEIKENIRSWVEFAAGYGTVIIKPNGKSVEVFLPEDFMVVSSKNGKITGVVFINKAVSEDGKVFYTRFEYHRWIDDIYAISNRCFRGTSENDVSKPVEIEATPWNNLEEDIAIRKLESPLYSVLKMPASNTIDTNSPMALPVFKNVINELKDLDIAYSRFTEEIDESRKITLLDSDRLVPAGTKVSNTVTGFEKRKKEMKLPRFVKAVYGASGDGQFFHEIQPSMETENRIKGMNNILSMIGFKIGFSNGYFVFNEKTGMITATQVTSDQARTIKLIDDVRKMIDICMIDLIKAINGFEDLYGDTGHVDIPDTIDTDELDRMIHIHFEPIFTNKEEDRQRALQLTNANYYPKWYYLHMYEGLSEEEAKRLTEEAQPKEKGLFEE